MANSIPVSTLWSYFCENRQDLLSNYHLIASNEEQGTEVYLTDEKGFPCFSVEVDGEVVYGAETVSYLDAENTYLELLNTYINIDEDDLIKAEEDDLRVKEITRAVEGMLEILIEEDPYYAGMSPQDVDDLTSVIEEFLYEQCGISIRHPTEIDGAIVDYPFGDPDEADVPPDDIDLPDIKQ